MEITPRYNIYNSDNIESRVGIAGTISHKEFTLSGSWEDPLLFIGTQEGADIEIYGLSLGYRTDLLDHLRGIISFGWYYPSVKIRNAFKQDGYLHAFADALETTSLHVLEMEWKNVDYQLKSGFGGTIGVNFFYRVNDWFSLNADISKRWLKLPACLYASDSAWVPVNASWQAKQSLDLGAIRFSLGFEINF